MKLQFPTKVIRNTKIVSITQARRNLSQPFGVNWAEDPNLYFNLGLLGHDGIDLPLFNGTPIYASHDGIVFEVDNNDDRDGLGVELYDEVQQIRTIYWHNQKNLVTEGERVKAGQQIAESGATGKAYGAHLHFSLYQTDNGNIINYSNGYHGAINPLENVEWLFDDMIITKELLPLLYKAILHREPDTEFWVGHTVDEFLRATIIGEEYKKLDFLITDARNL